jgi:hypothetical protein
MLAVNALKENDEAWEKVRTIDAHDEMQYRKHRRRLSGYYVKFCWVACDIKNTSRSYHFNPARS